MDNQVDIALRVYNANKFKISTRSICFSPKSVCSVLYMLLSSTDKSHLPFLKSVLSKIGNSYSCLSDTNLATGRTSCINNYMVLKDSDISSFKDLDVVFLEDTYNIKSILDYTEIDKEDNSLCSSINDSTDLINECFMIQPLPYNRVNSCIINYYWYRIVEEKGLTILNFYPSYQTVRMIMIICNNKSMCYQLEDINKDKLLDWVSYDYMKRSTLPFKLPKIRVESFLDITESFPEIFKEVNSTYNVRSNSLFEISPEKIFFATFTHSYIGKHDDHSCNKEVNNPFIVIIEDTSTKHWLFFGLIR
ncbi:putative serpin [Fowlpox virus]|nr:putative serpin [Fowlpox virus]